MTSSSPTPDSAHLFFTQGSSDKEYRISLQEVSAGWEVVAHYGKRGSTLKEHKKTPVPVDFSTARIEYDKALASKQKEGYTTDPSGAPAIAVPDIGLLKGSHQVMTDGECQDFRTPDLGWAHGNPNDFSQILLGSVTSEFWIGPSQDARSFVERLTNQYAAWAPNLVSPTCSGPDSSTGNASEVCVAYWENADLGLSMVSAISLFDAYAWKPEDRAINVPAINAFPSMRMLGFSGNDNCAAELAGELGRHVEDGDIAEEEGRAIARFLLTVTAKDFHEEVKEQLDEEFPSWKSKKKSQKP